MGWFSKEKKEEYHPNNRSSRKQCWEARDEYFQCLDKIGVVNALDPKQQPTVEKHCSKQDQRFDDNCATSWIKYFKEKRVIDFKREETIKRIEQEAKQRERNQ